MTKNVPYRRDKAHASWPLADWRPMTIWLVDGKLGCRLSKMGERSRAAWSKSKRQRLAA